MKELIDAIKLSIESENFAQRRTGRKGSSYYNGLAAGYREGYLNGFAEAGRQFLKTSQTKENQQSTEQLLLKHDVSGQSLLVCSHCGSSNIDKHGGDGIYCLDCHREL